MELTAELFRGVSFRERRRGYDTEDVDVFLEQAAVAAEDAQDRLRRAESLVERSTDVPGDDIIQSVLVVAQRVADQVVRDAREEAERLLTESREQAQATVAEADEKGRHASESMVAEARSSLAQAEDALRQARAEADAIKAWVAEDRDRLLAALREASSLLEEAGDMVVHERETV